MLLQNSDIFQRISVNQDAIRTAFRLDKSKLVFTHEHRNACSSCNDGFYRRDVEQVDRIAGECSAGRPSKAAITAG